MTKQINYKVLLLLAILTLSYLLPAFETAVYAQPDGNMYFITDPVDDYFEPHTDLQLSYLSSPHNTATSFAKGKEHLSEPKPLHLSWNTVCDASLDLPAEYTVELSESPEFDNVRSIVVTEPCADIYNLMTATRYYWRVTATVNGVRYCGETNTFTTSDLLPRNLAVDGITNVRDLGGWKTMDGGKVRQGLMYRCSKLNDSESTVQLISQKGIDTMRSDLGIRSEIELRRQDEYGGLTNSVLGDDINYYLCHMSSGGDIITSNYASLRSLFYILSDINNYPLIFHCSIGTDRTGMVAYIVNGLLGVSENYLMRDYLFSNFGNIGGSRKVTTISGKYPKIFKQYKGATLSEKIRNYLIEKAGVAPWEIDAVISIMKEPAPEYSIKGEPIYSEQDFLSMSPDGEYYLAEDISVASSYPQAFFGKIDGCGHTVTTSVPLFEICDGTIENLNIEGVISSSACAGALASDTNGITLRNVNNYAHVFSSSSAGGLIARSSGGNTDIFDCANYGRITGGDHSGGLFGDCGSELTIKDCENHGRVVSDGYAGGICGNVSGSIFAENVYNFGNVKGYSLYSGGLFGSAGTKSIFKTLTACGNYGSVSGCDYAAGIFGYVMANSRTAQFSYVYNTGDITATAQSAVAAGLVSDYESGTLGLVACYNAGEITADGDLYSAEVELFYNKDDNFDEGYIYSNYCRTSDPAYRYYDSTNDADIFVFADGTDTMALPYAEEDLAGGALCSMLNSIHFHSDMYKQVNGYPATTESVKTQTTEPEICAEKIGGYKVRLNWLDPELTYVIRYATGEYADISSVKKGINSGFARIDGKSNAVIVLPTDGVHTIAVQCVSELKYLGTFSVDTSDIESELDVTSDNLTVRVGNLLNAAQVKVLQNNSVVLKKSTFETDGLKYWTEFTVPAAGTYTITVRYTDGVTAAGEITVTVPEANVLTNGRVFTLQNYGANNVSYMRFAKGEISTAAEMKSASDLRIFGRKYFTGDTASFAALDAVNGTSTTYTVQVGYASGYSEFITFDITPTVPVITTTSDSITLSNVQTNDYYIDWVRCAPGELSSLYAIRHANGSQVKKTEHIVNGTITFTGLSAGTYTLYYLYDGWNLSEGMVTVIVN